MRVTPSLRQLRFLVALSEHLHFGRAAEACFVTQSTLSSALKDMEDIMGVALVERTRRSVMMTPIGEEIAARGRLVLRDVEDMMDLAESSAKPLTGRLRLGVIPTIGPFVLPGITRITREAFPDLKLYLREEQTVPLLEHLREGTVDLALIALPWELDQSMDSMVLGHDAFSLVCPSAHDLAGPGEVSGAQLMRDDLLLLEEGHCLRDHALGVCGADRRRSESFQATSLTTLTQMVESGLGITLLPDMAVKAGLAKDLCVRPVKGDAMGRDIALVWRKASHRAEDYPKLGEVMKAVLNPQS